jgi:hypothetical protein
MRCGLDRIMHAVRALDAAAQRHERRFVVA